MPAQHRSGLVSGLGSMTTKSRGSKAHCSCCKNWCPSCGVPKCRVTREGKWAEGTLSTEYAREFPAKQGHFERAGKKDGYVPSIARFDGTTTHKADFTQKGAAAPRRERDSRAMPAVPFAGVTTYEANFFARPGVHSLPAARPVPDWSAPFVGLSTYNAEFIARRTARPATAAPARAPPNVPFDGTSEYREQFPLKQGLPHEPRARPALLPSTAVASATTYGRHFVPKEATRPAAKVCCEDHRHAPQLQAATSNCHDRPWTGCSSCGGGRSRSRPMSARW